jgi:hypothetical protein
MTDTAGHVPISVAARIAGVHERTIRRWIAAGVLADSPGRSGGHRARLVDVEAVRQLAAGLHEPDTGGLDSRTDPDRPPREPDTSVADFLAVIERQQQTIMELSGRLGFYQARVQSLEEEVKLLSAPAACQIDKVEDQAPDNPTQPTPEPASAPVRASQGPPSRPWWRFWGGWTRQPV